MKMTTQKCEICGKRFEVEQELNDHVEKQHPWNIVCRGAYAKVFKAFFRDIDIDENNPAIEYKTQKEIANSLGYSNSGLVSRCIKEFKKRHYLERKREDNRIKKSKKGKKGIYRKTLRNCYRGNLQPFWDLLDDIAQREIRADREEPDIEELLNSKKLFKRYVRRIFETTYRKRGSMFDGDRDVIEDIKSLVLLDVLLHLYLRNERVCKICPKFKPEYEIFYPLEEFYSMENFPYLIRFVQMITFPEIVD